MKNINTLALIIAGGLAVCRLANAQVHDGDAPGHDGTQHHVDPASAAAHLAQFFPKIAAFDTNKDGKLDEKEKKALAKAVADGTVELPAHIPSNGGKPNTEMMLNHICEMYPQVARYDANHDGILDDTEQAALKIAIEKGELVFSHGAPPQHPNDTQH